RMFREFRVAANVGRPQVAYREALTKPAQGEGRYVKQTGGKGQCGHGIVDFDPLERGTGYEYEWGIRGDRLSKEWSKAVQQGIKEAMENGVIAGYPMVDLKATVVDGSQHEVDSNEMAFKIAGSMALKAAVPKAGPVIVEPIMKVEVIVPEEFMGDVIGDLNSRRGHVQGSEERANARVITASVPLATLFGYVTDLRSRTQGRGANSREHHHLHRPRRVRDRQAPLRPRGLPRARRLHQEHDHRRGPDGRRHPGGERRRRPHAPDQGAHPARPPGGGPPDRGVPEQGGHGRRRGAVGAGGAGSARAT